MNNYQGEIFNEQFSIFNEQFSLRIFQRAKGNEQSAIYSVKGVGVLIIELAVVYYLF